MSKKKTNRSTSRLLAVQALYQNTFEEKTLDEIARAFIAGDIGTQLIKEDERTQEETFVPVIAPDTILLTTILSSFSKNEETINDMIASSLNDEWSIEKLELTFKAILQAGIAEIIACPETPAAIVITEYMDIANSFYSLSETKVVNGILDKLTKILRDT